MFLLLLKGSLEKILNLAFQDDFAFQAAFIGAGYHLTGGTGERPGGADKVSDIMVTQRLVEAAYFAGMTRLQDYSQ